MKRKPSNCDLCTFGNVSPLRIEKTEDFKALDRLEEERGLGEEEKERKRVTSGIWRLLSYKRKLVGDKNLESDGLRRVINALNSLIGLPTLIEDVIPLKLFLSMALYLPTKTILGIMRFIFMNPYSLNIAIGGLG